VHAQDSTYVLMLTAVMAALLLARRRWPSCHAVMALAVTIKLSPLYYAKNVLGMSRRSGTLFAAIAVTGLVVPYFIWDNYLYIYRYGNEIKGDWLTALSAVGVACPFAILMWYIETRLEFDMEERVGWGLLPFALFLALKTNAARHLLVVLLVPDKRGVRNVALAVALALPAMFPHAVRFGASLTIAEAVLAVGLAGFLNEIGWAVVADDLRHPRRTAALMLRRT
jgi:hypothetical protein